MLSSLIPSNIKNYTSNAFISFGYGFIFNSLLPNIKKGQLIVEIDDENYPQYKTTTGSPLKFGNLNSNYEFENTTANLKILNLYGFLTKILIGHDVGFGESYVLGYFKCDSIKSLTKIFILNFDSLSNNKSTLSKFNQSFNSIIQYLYYNVSFDSSSNAIKTHYNITSKFYEVLLGETLCYTSGIYSSPKDSLYDGQIRKYDSIIEKANFTKDDHILDIGSGWGTFLIHAVKKTGCKATGITISEEQLEYANRLIKKEGLEHLIDLQLCHYKDHKGKYSKIVAIEMMEHVGPDNIGLFFNKVDEILQPDGIFVCQVITYRDKDFEINRMGKKVGFISKYIFLGGELPCISVIVNAAAKHSTFELQDAESIGPHYVITLDQWNDNLLQNQDNIKNLGFDQQFINMFEYYLNYCSAGFETNYLNDVQMIYSRPLNTKNLKISYKQ